MAKACGMLIYKMITDQCRKCGRYHAFPTDIPREDWDLTELNELLTSDHSVKTDHERALTDEVKDVKELKHQLKEKAVQAVRGKRSRVPGTGSTA